MRVLVAFYFSHLAAIVGLVEERPAVEPAGDAAPLATLHFFLNAT